MANVKAIETMALLEPDKVADEITELWSRYKQARISWENEMLEIRDYKYATSTRTTSSGHHSDFKNSTTVPKLAQIAMNLQANYKAHLFSSPNWAQFEAFDKSAADQANRRVVEAYVRTKIKRKDYEGVFSKCITNWIDTGATFAQQRYITETYKDVNDQTKVLYQGAVLERIEPDDIVFDVTAATWKQATKVIRKTYTLGDIHRLIEEDTDTPFTFEMLEELRSTRIAVRNSGFTRAPEGVDWKGTALSKTGFGDLLDYMNQDIVEVLEFYGDHYDIETGVFLKNHKIIVLDRRKVIFSEPIRSRNGSQYLYYSGWEDRPNNLMGMSPLARLVGMQYKLDKLENQRADVFDKIINPPIVEKGDVEFYGVRGAPGGRYVVDEDGDVREMSLDAKVLNADFQIQQTMNIMEEMAGSPKNASGERTPGEKTKFEIQFLENGQNRLFRDKTSKFEKEFVEAVLDDMVELALDNLGTTDLVSTESSEFRTQEFIAVSKSDLNISGQIRARGSRLFAEKATALQNIIGIYSSPMAPLITPHTSRIKLAETLEDLADIKEFNLITPNIGVQEDQRSAQLANQANQTTQEVDAVNSQEPVEDDLEEE